MIPAFTVTLRRKARLWNNMVKRLLFVIVLTVLLLADITLAATYYVATTGNDKNPGTLQAPWKTLAYAESRLAAGDNVLLRGGIYPTGCAIDIPNTSWRNYNGENVVIDGEHTRPGGRYDPLVTIKASGVTWDGIHITRGTGYNMHVKGASQVAKINGVSIRNSNISDSLNQNLVIINTSGLLLERCQFIYGNSQIKPSGKYDGASVDLKYSDNFTVRYNVVREAYRDGLIADVGSFDGLIEYNQLYGNRMSQCYACNSVNMTIRYNLVYGWVNPESIAMGTGNAGSGIVLGSEAQWGSASSGNHKVYGNLLAGCSKNISLGTEKNAAPVANCQIYNNTLVEAQPNTSTTIDSTGFYIGKNVGTGHVFKNNIVWQTAERIAIIANSAACSFDYNLWSKSPPAVAMGRKDIPYAVPLLRKTSGWDSLRAGVLTGREFALQDKSPAIGMGLDLRGDFSLIPDCDRSNWVTTTIELVQNGSAAREGEIGADVYVQTAN